MKFFKSWRWHNYVAHPLMQLFQDLKMKKLAEKIHDKTLPEGNKDATN